LRVGGAEQQSGRARPMLRSGDRGDPVEGVRQRVSGQPLGTQYAQAFAEQDLRLGNTALEEHSAPAPQMAQSPSEAVSELMSRYQACQSHAFAEVLGGLCVIALVAEDHTYVALDHRSAADRPRISIALLE